MFSGCVTGVWCDINYPVSRPGSSSTSPAQPPPAPPRVVASTMLPNNWIRTNFVTLNLCSPGFVRKMLLITTGSSAFHTFYSDFSTVGRRDDNFQLHQHSIWQRTSDDRRHKGNCAPTLPPSSQNHCRKCSFHKVLEGAVLLPNCECQSWGGKKIQNMQIYTGRQCF